MTMLYGKITGIDKPISRLVQGTIPLNPDAPDSGFSLLDDTFALGCTAYDTAVVYGPEREKAFGRWVRERGLREKVVILAKGVHHDNSGPRVTPEGLATDLNNTLAYMETEYIDLYVLHRDNPAVPVGPIVEALNEHLRAGRIRAFGGSNWTHDRIRAANEYAAEHGLTPFAVSSPNFSLAEQVKEPWANCVSISGPQNEAARAYYQQTQLPLFTWSSLAGGFFSGRLTRENLAEFESYLDKLAVECYAYDDNFKRLDRVQELAEQKGKTVPQIALAYVMAQPLNIFALVGCQNGSEFKANVDALDIKLTPAEAAYLDLRADAPV